ncbi:hypothetical protein, partial [Stenotrophomonas muris]|uniref:hypothetical protein n=1 Tax=Stenotrophomonas muris TaxID=2963283 RepID=UPI00300ECB35
ATADGDSSAAFPLCTNRAKINAHLVEKVGILTPRKCVSERVVQAGRRVRPQARGRVTLAMLQWIG